MNKLCKTLQNLNGIIAIVAYALLAVYALGMATPIAPTILYESTLHFYDAIQPYNNGILVIAIIGLVLAAFYSVLRCRLRKVYYVSNFVWSGAYIALVLVTAIYSLIGISKYQSSYSTLPFDEMNTYFTQIMNGAYINPNTSVFLLGYLVIALIIISGISVGLVTFVKAKEKITQPDITKEITSSKVEAKQ